MAFLALCPLPLYAASSTSYPDHSWITPSFTYVFRWTRAQINYTMKIKPFVFNIYSPMRQDTNIGCRWMLPKGFSSLTTPQKTPTHRLSEPTVSGPWALSRHCICSNTQNITFRCTNNNNKNHIQRSSLNIPKIDFSIIWGCMQNPCWWGLGICC